MCERFASAAALLRGLMDGLPSALEWPILGWGCSVCSKGCSVCSRGFAMPAAGLQCLQQEMQCLQRGGGCNACSRSCSVCSRSCKCCSRSCNVCSRSCSVCSSVCSSTALPDPPVRGKSLLYPARVTKAGKGFALNPQSPFSVSSAGAVMYYRCRWN